MIATAIALMAAAATVAPPDTAPWEPTIRCPDDREYRDVFDGAGRDESCARRLAGDLVVRDGPARSWYSRNHLHEEGRYESGRKIGRWRECNQFDRCLDHDYPVVEAYERNHAVTPDVPVSYAGGRYVIDFGSCWSTAVSREGNGATLDMTFSGGIVRCQITYAASGGTEPVGGASGTDGTRVDCQVPYSVGRREFGSLDLRSELPKAGLPQFCRPATRATDLSGDPPEQAFAIWTSQPILGAGEQSEGSAWVLLANLLDVDCASIQKQPTGSQRLTVRLNRFAEQLVLDQVGKTALKSDACNRWLPLPPMRITRDASGHSLFGYDLGPGHDAADQERKCIESQIDLQVSCTPGAPDATTKKPARPAS